MFTVDQTGNLESDRYSGTGMESRTQVSKCTSSCPFGWFGSGLMSYLKDYTILQKFVVVRSFVTLYVVVVVEYSLYT